MVSCAVHTCGASTFQVLSSYASQLLMVHRRCSRWSPEAYLLVDQLGRKRWTSPWTSPIHHWAQCASLLRLILPIRLLEHISTIYQHPSPSSWALVRRHFLLLRERIYSWTWVQLWWLEQQFSKCGLRSTPYEPWITSTYPTQGGYQEHRGSRLRLSHT